MTKKKKENKNAFDLEEALENLKIPNMFVEGFRAYIENNNLKVKSKKEFEKLLDEFRSLSL